MSNDLVLMLVIMNPFAQTLYLSKLMSETTWRQFGGIYLQGTLLTYVICLLCAYLGEFVIFTVFQVTLPAMRVFGGLINLQLAYSYVMKGPEGVKLVQGNITEMAQQIALPIMVGAGVVWISMRIGRIYAPLEAAMIIGAALAINFGFVFGYQVLSQSARGRLKLLLAKYFGVAMRFNALLIGAVSVQMILGGIREFMAETPS